MIHALDRVPEWAAAWRASGRLILLLDFDGTLAPIVQRAEQAAVPEETRAALERLRGRPGVELAVVSGRGLADAREKAGLPGILYAGNHGLEIEGPGVRHVHSQATGARKALADVAARLREALTGVAGAWVEDKGLTLSIHYRLAPRHEVGAVREAVAAEVERAQGLRMTAGKEVLEVRPDVPWDKGRAVEFLLDHLEPPSSVPVLYVGDDRTDEDAFRALAPRRSGAGVVVAAEPPSGTAASCYLRDPGEVKELLLALSMLGPG